MEKFHNGKIEIISPVVKFRSQPALNVNVYVKLTLVEKGLLKIPKHLMLTSFSDGFVFHNL